MQRMIGEGSGPYAGVAADVAGTPFASIALRSGDRQHQHGRRRAAGRRPLCGTDARRRVSKPRRGAQGANVARAHREPHCSSRPSCRAPSRPNLYGSFRSGLRWRFAPHCTSAASRRRCSGPTTCSSTSARSPASSVGLASPDRRRAWPVASESTCIACPAPPAIEPPPAFCDDVARFGRALLLRAVLTRVRSRRSSCSTNPIP